ncbi:MAG: hypothetical protein ACRDT2_17505 [Natronosporangium sp.]
MNPTDRLTRRGRAVRLAVTAVAAGLLLAGTVWGEDDHFPFGPFKMYASAVDPDAPAEDTRLEATDAAGQTVLLTPANTGFRRAEFEGQLGRFEQQPELLATVLDAYQRRNPAAPHPVEVRLVVRWHEVRDFEVTGAWHDEVLATWRR